MRYLRISLVFLALGIWAAGPLTGASAAGLLAPTYQSSEPEDGAMMDEPPSEVTATFSEPLDSSSWMIVHDDCGKQIHSGSTEVQLDEMTVGIGKTPSGTYHVVFKAVGLAGGAATGTTGGTFEFMVHDGKPCKGGGGGHQHGGKKKQDGKHDRHGRDHGDRGGDHGGDHGGGGGSGHDGHAGMPGMPASGGHTGHTMGGSGTGGGHGDHGGGPGKPGTPPAAPDNPPLATGGDVPVSADGQAVLVGLGLALAVGILGGWLLRMTGMPV